MKKIIYPPKLKRGACIGITCPAGYMEAEKASTCIQTLQEWGYEVLVGKTLGSESETYFSGTDEERLDELQAMLDDNSVDAILFGRGGYGMGRIIDQLDFKKFKKNPKWVIGFSDITIFHCHVLKNYGIATLHAPMAAAFNDGGNKNEFVLSLANVLMGGKSRYHSAPHPFNQKGKAEGILIGGNLCLLAHVIGTNSDFDSKNKILFLEDVGEYIYSIDRMLIQLKRSGKLDHLAGLILGGFTDCKDTERPFGKAPDQIIRELTAAYNYPICYEFPVSHEKENFALKIGGKYQFTVNKNGAVLREIK